MDKLKGLKIANVYHDSAYGKETLPVLLKQAEKYGFELKGFSRCSSWFRSKSNLA